MAFRRLITIPFFALTLFFTTFPAQAIPPDFNADRRVNIKCPASIDVSHEGQFELDGFKTTLRGREVASVPRCPPIPDQTQPVLSRLCCKTGSNRLSFLCSADLSQIAGAQ